MAEKVLIVDDEPESLKLFGYSLHRQGYEVFVAQSGQEALDNIRKYKPDLVVLDIMMPGMDGFEVCRQIRADSETKSLLVMMLTAKSEKEDVVAGFESGADDYLSKPVSLAELFARVKALLARSRVTALGSPSSIQTEVLAFLGVKGGVGTTTLAVNTAVAIAGRGRSVVLVELRASQGMAGAMLKISSQNHLGTLMAKDPKALNREAVRNALVSHFSGLSVLLAPQVAVGRDEEQMGLDASKVELVIAALLGTVDCLLLDLGSGLPASTVAALRHCSRTILVSEHCLLSLRLCRPTLAAVSSLGLTGNRVDVVVNNRSRQDINLPLTDMERLVGQPILLAIPPMSDLLFRGNVEKEGRPVAMLQPDAPGLQALADLAEALVQSKIAG